MPAVDPLFNPFSTTNPAKLHNEAETFFVEEVRLANRNYGMLSEVLSRPVTPVGLHYTLNHHDVPYYDASTDGEWFLEVVGLVNKPAKFSVNDLKDIAARNNWTRTVRVILECAGNGRALPTEDLPPADTSAAKTVANGLAPKWPSMPWLSAAASTADWTGIPLSKIVELCGGITDLAAAKNLVFFGNDFGSDGKNNMHYYGRSISAKLFGQPDLANPLPSPDDILICWAMNSGPLLPQHGNPVRAIVPGFYGCASVKWLTAIAIIDTDFVGHQQTGTYIMRSRAPADEKGVPVDFMKVKSLWAPIGIPDFYTRQRLVFVKPDPNTADPPEPGPQDKGFQATGKTTPKNLVIRANEQGVAEIRVTGRAWVGTSRARRVKVAKVEVSLDGGKTWGLAELGKDPVPPADEARDLETFTWTPFSFVYKLDVKGKAVGSPDTHHSLICRATDSQGNAQPLQSKWDWAGFAKNGVDTLSFWVRYV